MDEKKEEGKGSCGMSCGCCGCKAIKALVLLLLGGVIGFLIGHCHRMCATSQAAVSAPAAEAPAPATHKKSK